MTSLPNQILLLIKKAPGLTDREITNRLRGSSAPQQPINIAARGLEGRGGLVRRKREDGLIGNYPGERVLIPRPVTAKPITSEVKGDLSEDRLKQYLENWLRHEGWEVEVAWGRSHGTDIRAFRGGKRWMIEVKGIGSRAEMRVNYFIGILGETLQRMEDPYSRYSIALPDVQQFRNLWKRLPRLAKKRTQISALFVSSSGEVIEAAD